MKEIGMYSGEVVKSLSEAVIQYDGQRAEFCHLSENQLSALEWARDFMRKYERKLL